jgi:Tfp pilus assembly pilus retraction ATPase PilT
MRVIPDPRRPVFARLKGPMRQALRNAGVLDLVGEHHDHPTVRAAVVAAPAGNA